MKDEKDWNEVFTGKTDFADRDAGRPCQHTSAVHLGYPIKRRHPSVRMKQLILNHCVVCGPIAIGPANDRVSKRELLLCEEAQRG